MSRLPTELTDILGNPIAFYPQLKQVTGSVAGAVFLSQCMYWSTMSSARARGGWFSHETKCFQQQTAISRDAVARTRKRLRERGVLYERRTTEARTAMRLDWDALIRQVGKCAASTTCGCNRGKAAQAAHVAAHLENQRKKTRSGNRTFAHPETREPDISRDYRDHAERSSSKELELESVDIEDDSRVLNLIERIAVAFRTRKILDKPGYIAASLRRERLPSTPKLQAYVLTAAEEQSAQPRVRHKLDPERLALALRLGVPSAADLAPEVLESHIRAHLGR